MKRGSIFAVAGAVALLVCATALAHSSAYKGGFQPSGTLKFKIAKRDGKRFIPPKKLSFAALPLTCDDGTTPTTSGHTLVAINVKHGRFHKKLFAEDPQGQGVDSVLVLHGRLEHAGRKATGTMRIHGSSVPTDPGGHGACDTGLLPWTVRRR